MGGKSGGPLASWIREFTTLVFVQTVQAFIFAIIMILILSSMGQAAGIAGDDYNSALGLMCAFALTSLFKVEELIKKIFGLSGTKADHQSAIKSVAKTAFALQIGKRVMNNGAKFAGGVKKVAGANKDAKKARKRLEEDKADLGLGGGARRSVATAGSGGGLGGGFGGGFGGGSGGGLGGGSNTSTGAADMSNDEIFNSNAIDPKTKQKLRAALRAAEKEAKEIKKQRDEGLKDIASSIAETGGAIIGGTAGAILGGADGNLDEAFQGLVSGMGVGDAVGEGIVNAADSIGKFTRNRVDGIKDFADEVEKEKAGVEGRLRTVRAAGRTIRRNMGQIGSYRRDIDSFKDEIEAYENTVDDT